MNINKIDFNNHGGGERFWGQLSRDADADAQNITNLFFQASLFYSARELLPKLEAYQDEQQKKLEDLKRKLAELDKRIEKPKNGNEQNKDKDERGKTLAQYNQTQTTLSQLIIAIRYVKSVKKPDFPAWLRELLIAELVTA